MKNRLTLAILSGMTVMGIQGVSAETYVPYLPVKVDLSTQLEESNFSSFRPEGDYSLQVYAQAGAVISVADNNFVGFKYQAPQSGTYRFAIYGSFINIYCNNIFVDQLTVGAISNNSDIVFPQIFDDADDASAKTGIYSDLNLIQNPGFEDIAEGEGMSEEGRHIPAVWQSENFGLEGARSMVFTDYDPEVWGDMVDEIEGKGALQHHGWSDGAGKYFFQELETQLESNTVYNLSFLTWNHGDTYRGTYTAKFGYEENDATIASITWSQPTDSAYQKKIHNYVFKTEDIDTSKPVVFTITRNENVIAHFDRITLVKATSSSVSTGLFLEGASSATFEDGTAYAPNVELVSGQYYDFTTLIQNPDVASNSGWLGTNSTATGEQFATATNNRYLDAYKGDDLLEYNCYQTVTGLENGVYKMIVAARTNDDEFELFASSIAGDWSIGIINNGNGRGEDGDLSTLGGGWNLHTIENIRVVNGELTIGGRGTATKNAAWLSMDEFRLYKMDEVSDDIIIEALTDNLSAYIKEIENALYDIRGNLTSLMINEIGSKITEAKAVVNNASRTADMLNNAYNQLKETYEITVEFSNVSDQLRDLIEEIQGTNLDEIPDSFIDPVGEILRYAEELLEDDSRTYDVLAETYSSLRVAFDRAIAAQGPYAALSIAISDVQTLLDINPNLSESLEYYLSVASNVLDNEDATSEMYVAAKNQLYTRVANLYKGYEKESYIDELENTGCDLIDETSIPDYWKIDKGVGNTYTNTGQHYSVLLYEEGTDEYEDAKANRYLDSWNGTAGAMVYKAEQTVVLGEKGLYILRAAARSTGTGAYIFAGDNQTEITVSGDQGGELGYGWNIIEVPFVITDANADQKITIGVKTTEGWGGTWFSADDFDLDYYPGFDPTTGIGSVEVSNVKVYCRDGYIVVDGADKFTVVSIEGRIMPANAKLSQGVYYVIVEGKSYPVFVR